MDLAIKSLSKMTFTASLSLRPKLTTWENIPLKLEALAAAVSLQLTVRLYLAFQDQSVVKPSIHS